MSTHDGHAEGTPVGASEAAGPTLSRLEQRKARTRRALLDAARSILIVGDAGNATIQQITDAADLGFGSFYNHFESKTQLFEAVVSEVLELWGQLIDGVTEGVEDPAEVFSISVRTSGRLGVTHPEAAAVIAKYGFALMDSPSGLAPRAARDLQKALDAGRFTLASPAVALATATGALLGLLHLALRDGTVADDDVDEVAEQLLRMFGLTARQARKIATAPLPGVPASPGR